jgi:hypothetical protein
MQNACLAEGLELWAESTRQQIQTRRVPQPQLPQPNMDIHFPSDIRLP